MDDPALSIIVCTRNRGHRLSGTLQSLAALPSEPPVEIIVVDNASTDDTKETILAAAANDARIRYLLIERIGLGAARDGAWREAKAPIISFTDDDCYLAADFSSSVVAAFGDDISAGVIAGRVMLHDPTDAAVTIDESPQPRHYDAYAVLLAGSIQGANMSFRRSALEQSGGFDPELGAGTPFPSEDIDAAAAVLWAGYSGRYDPRPMVSHHHGRKAADVPALKWSYDRGRGAYWAKYILRRSTRNAYVAAWWSVTKQHWEPDQAGRIRREYVSALRYAIRKKRFLAIIMVAPFAASALAYVLLRNALRRP